MGSLLFNSTSQVVDLYVVVYLFIFIMGLISEKKFGGQSFYSNCVHEFSWEPNR